MVDEPDNIVLEHLRALRAESVGIRSAQNDLQRVMQDGFARVSQRIDRLETAVRGLRHLLGAALGARQRLLTEI